MVVLKKHMIQPVKKLRCVHTMERGCWDIYMCSSGMRQEMIEDDYIAGQRGNIGAQDDI
jgi:hypothetical protein